MAKTAVVSWKMFLCWFTFEILSTDELCVCVRDKTKIEAKNTSTEKGSYAEKKCCLNIEKKKFYAVCHGEVQFMRQSPRFMQICAVSTINVTSGAKSKTFPFHIRPPHVSFDINSTN